MNRRSFLKTIFVASVSLAVAPTDFLTPYSPPAEIDQWAILGEVLDKYYTPAIIEHLSAISPMWDKIEKMKGYTTLEGHAYHLRCYETTLCKNTHWMDEHYGFFHNLASIQGWNEVSKRTVLEAT